MSFLSEHESQLHAAPRGRRDQRGAALVFSLLLVMVIAGLGAGLIQFQSATQRRHEFAIDRRSALYLAEAGLGEAALAVSLGKSGVLASEQTPISFGGGVYWVDSSDLPDDRIVLTATARVRRAEIVTRMLVVPNLNPVAKLGFFGAERVEIGAGTLVDGYHSGRGSYDTQVNHSLSPASTGEHGLVGSDGDILFLAQVAEDEATGGAGSEEADKSSASGEYTEEEWGKLLARAKAAGVEAPADPSGSKATESTSSGKSAPALRTVVAGTARPGRAGTIQSDGVAEISDGVHPYEAPPYLPGVTLPTPGEVITGNVTISGSQVGVGTTSDVQVTGSVLVEIGATLRLEGPTILLANQLVVERDAQLILDDANGPIEIYTRQGLQLHPNSALNSVAADTEARGTSIFVDGTADARDRVMIEASGSFRGLIYAPDDIVRIPASLRWIGGAVARRLVTAENAHLSIDRRLAIGGDGLPTLPSLLAWQLLPLGDEIARELPMDPLVQLRLLGVRPLEPGKGAPETHGRVQYIDHSGSPQEYSGAISAFDPTVSARIVGASWVDSRDGHQRSWTTTPGSESTGALGAAREEKQAIRSTVLAEYPGTDVAVMNDDDAMVQVATVTDPALLAAAPEGVERAVERSNPDDADERQAEIDRAAAAGRMAYKLSTEAREHADNARVRVEAVVLADAAEETKSQTLADQIELEATQCEVAFDEARVAAIAAASAATFVEASAQADIAEKAAKQADLEYSELADLLSQLGALGV